MKTKLYVRLWDAWAFERIYYSQDEANKSCRSGMQTIDDITVYGTIENNIVFVATGRYGEFYGAFSSYEGTEALDIEDMEINRVEVN